MNVLITGFSAFPGVPTNPTQLLINDFRLKPPKITAGPVEMAFEIIETQYALAGEQIRTLLIDFKPQFALLLGVAESRVSFGIERFALNIDDCSAADATGDVRRGRRIEKTGPGAYETRVDVDKLREYLIRSDTDVEISNHAGSYVCNHAYYTALHTIETHGLSSRVVFVHVPLVPAARVQEMLVGGSIRALRADVEALINYLLKC
jgi:pyroglutamyl-peptidase